MHRVHGLHNKSAMILKDIHKKPTSMQPPSWLLSWKPLFCIPLHACLNNIFMRLQAPLYNLTNAIAKPLYNLLPLCAIILLVSRDVGLQVGHHLNATSDAMVIATTSKRMKSRVSFRTIYSRHDHHHTDLLHRPLGNTDPPLGQYIP